MKSCVTQPEMLMDEVMFLVVFRHCNAEMLHSVALNEGKCQLTLKDLEDLRYV